jgi:hypothetical protein
MPKAKKWVLLANFIDRTLIRNALAFEIARHTSQKWVPQGRFVDVFLNKEYIGNYYLCEKIQVKQNRINPITTTYLLELDLNYDEEYKFKTAYKNLPINIKYPDKPTILQFNHIHNYLDSIECALYSTCKDFNVLSKINLESLASFWIIQEIAQNGEARNPKSVFIHIDSVLNFGPVWDFDWQTFMSKKKGFELRKCLWLDTLKNNPDFKAVIKQEWNMDKKSFPDLTFFIDSIADYIHISHERNEKRWPLYLMPNLVGDEKESFATAIQMLKNSYINRLCELDSLFNSL